MNIIAPHSGSELQIVDRGRRALLDPDEAFGSYEEAGRSLQFDVREILMIIRRNALLIAGVIVLALVAGLTITLLTQPKYIATASIQIDQSTDRILNTEELQPSVASQDADRFLQTQVDVLKSRTMAVRVAQSLGLLRSPKFYQSMGIKVSDPNAVDSRDPLGKEAAAGLLVKGLDVTLPRQSRVVSISFESPDPQFSALIANTYAKEFISNNLQRKYDSSSYARDFLNKQLAEAKVRLERSEQELNDYARGAGLIKTGQVSANGTASGPQSITTASLIQLNSAANDARSARVGAEQKWRTTATSDLMSSPDVLSNSAIQAMLQKQAELTAALSQERARHLATHPNVIQLQAQLNELTDQIHRLALSIKSSIREQYRTALQQEQSLDRQVSGLKGDTLAEQDRSVRYNILSREADTNRTLYDGLLQRFKEISAEAGVTTNNISIVDPAAVPYNPSSPKLKLNLALAFLIGAGIAAGLVFIKEQLDDAIRLPDDIERKLGLTVLGVIPLAKTGENMLELLESPRSNVSEAYHALRTSLLYSTVESLPKTILVTSSQPAEGKSTTSFAIAADLAKLEKRVLLIDTDLRRPSLHGVVGTRNNVGLSSLLTQQSSLAESLKTTAIPNLSFIPSGPIPPSPTELLGSVRMRELLDILKADFDVVVLDGPPVLGLADAPILAAIVEATIFVVESSRGHRGATKSAVRRLHSAHSRILGGVLTKFNSRKAGGGQYYGYEYYAYGATDEPGRLPGK